MSATHRISVSGDRLRFDAAHMAILGGSLEPLHGHSYAVTAELVAPLKADALVYDFGALRRAVTEIIEALDHKLILQTRSRLLALKREGGRWLVGHEGRSYAFPEEDVAALPIDNSTAERLAEWIALRLGERLREEGVGVEELTVSVAEGPGQTGWYTVHN